MRQNDSPWRIERLERLAKAVDDSVGERLFASEICLHFNDAKGDLTVKILHGHHKLDNALRAALEKTVSYAWSAEDEDGADIFFDDVN